MFPIKAHLPLVCILLLATLGIGYPTSSAQQGSTDQGSSGQGALPPDEAYVTVRDGHLKAGAERVRLWCVIGGFPNYANIAPNDSAEQRQAKTKRAYADADALVARFKLLGFNGMRMWQYAERDYVKGDGSNEDVLDYFVSRAKAAGFRIWLPSISWAPVKVDDVGLGGESADAAGWKQAVETGKDSVWIARVWDPRLEAAQRAQIQRRTQHFNHHTGLKWADDPVFAIWELTNEEWWMMKMVGGNWQNLPKFFQDSLRRHWHDFLREKYRSSEQIRAKWKFLLPGEDLDRGTIQLAPIAAGAKLEDAGMDPQAKLQLIQSRSGGKQEWTRDDFTRARGEDVLEFFLRLQLRHKGRLREFLKQQGKSARLGPCLYDTGIGYEIQSQFLQQSADAVSHDAYVNGSYGPSKGTRSPWYTGLEEWPRIAQDVPWLEHNRVEGKPFLCYETQIQQPAKYRAEFPLRILALAAIQDWDAVCWHYWGSVDDITTAAKPFERSMDVTTGWHPQGYHYTFDEVQNAMMRASGLAFRNGALKPASKPTKFIFGRRSLYDPASMDYGGSYGKMGLRMLPTTYQNGVRLQIDPSREDDEVVGPTVDPLGINLPTRIVSTPEIRFEPQKGGLWLDSPSAVGFTGFAVRYPTELRFSNGVILKGIRVAVPPKMPYPQGIEEEKYVGFQLSSEDGQPLARSRRVTLALHSTSFNSGYKNGEDNNGKAEAGGLPVLVARVEATLVAPALAGMRVRFLDWHGQEIDPKLPRKIGPDGVLKIPAKLPIWITELIRD